MFKRIVGSTCVNTVECMSVSLSCVWFSSICEFLFAVCVFLKIAINHIGGS